MTTINRFSSRRQRLDHAFLADRLREAKSYKRIAGYFRSSIFELVGEEIASIPKVRIICNSELDTADVAVSKHVRETALKERWNEAPSEVEALLHRERYRRLHELLTSGRVEIRVVPKDRVFIIKTRGSEDIARCPFCIAIVSTGLIVHGSDERRHLLERKYGTIVLDREDEGDDLKLLNNLTPIRTYLII